MRGAQEGPDAVTARKLLGRRALLLGGLQGAVLLTIASRLRYLQVTASPSLSEMAERNRISVRLLQPMRGEVFDRDGLLLAGNLLNYRIMLVREQAGDIDRVLANLRAIIPISDEEIQARIEEIRGHRTFDAVTVAENVTWQQVAQVSANAPALPGISVEYGSTRTYPFERAFAHVIGYVGPVSKEDQQGEADWDPLLHFPGFKIGKTGLEKSLDRELRGSGGNRTIEVNAQGREIREVDGVDAQAGRNLQITIRSGLQAYAAARLGGEAAAIVVIDLSNDHIIASVSAPTFDPNKFISGYTESEFQELLETRGSPLINRPVRSVYPPGSTFKMVTALAALEAGIIGPDDEITCTGEHETQHRTFHCWRSGGHGQVNFRKGLSESCDVYYYLLAQQVDIGPIAAMARKLGLGARTDIPLPDVARGLIPTRDWKLENKQNAWLIGDTLNAGIGQGYVQASALQIAVMTARIATGRRTRPGLLMAIDDNPVTRSSPVPLDIGEDSLELVRDAMFAATNDRLGTAYGSRSFDSSFPIAGKTGTSQVRTISLAERRRGIRQYADLPWKDRDHALYCGFAPYENPRYAIAVIIEHGGSGSQVAAPIARDILMAAHYGKVPPLEAYPPNLRSRIRREQDALEQEMQGTVLGGLTGETQA